jgi:hypothetical protein
LKQLADHDAATHRTSIHFQETPRKVLGIDRRFGREIGMLSPQSIA